MRRCFLIADRHFQEADLIGMIQPHDMILALSTEAYIRAVQIYPQTQSVEHLVPYDCIKELNLVAELWEESILAKWSPHTEVDGISIARADGYAQYWFFQEAALADLLSQALDGLPFERFEWIGTASMKPQVYTEPSGIVCSILKARLGQRLRKHESALEKRPSPAPFAWLRRLAARWRHSLPRTHCDIVLLMDAAGCDRHSEAIQEIRREWGSRFQIWLFGVLPPDWRRRPVLGSSPFCTLQMPQEPAPDIQAMFQRGWAQWLDERDTLCRQIGAPFLAAPSLNYHFSHYFLDRWPRLATWGRLLERTLRRCKVSWLISSTLWDGEIVLAYELSRTLGIQSLALPHGQWHRGRRPMRSNYVLFANAMVQDQGRQAISQDNRPLLCRNGVDRMTFVASKRYNRFPRPGPWALVLTGMPDGDAKLMPVVRRPAFYLMLDHLTIPPERLGINIAIKDHPRATIMDLIEHGANGSSIWRIPPDAPIIGLLDEAWVIVFADHVGSIVASAIEAEKPLVFLEASDFYLPDAIINYHESGFVIHSVKELWQLLEEWRRQPHEYLLAVERTRRFKGEKMVGGDKTASEILKELVSGRGTRR